MYQEPLLSLHQVDVNFFKKVLSCLERYDELYDLYKDYYVHKVAIPYEIKKGWFKPYNLVTNYPRFQWVQRLIFMTTAVPFVEKSEYTKAFLKTKLKSYHEYEDWPNLSTKLYSLYYPKNVGELFQLHNFNRLYTEHFVDVKELRNIAKSVVDAYVSNDHKLMLHYISGQRLVTFKNVKLALDAAEAAIKELNLEGNLG